MSATRDLQDLLDQVSETRGWRVAKTTDGQKIYPPNPMEPAIFIRTTSSGRDRQLTELRQRLRRAGFPFRNGNSLPETLTGPATATPITVKEIPMSNTPAPAPAKPNGHTEPTLFQQASGCISRIMTELATLESLLKKIDAEGQDWQKAKASLAVLLGR